MRDVHHHLPHVVVCQQRGQRPVTGQVPKRPLEPLGVVVTTDLDLAGLRGELVFLTWEMFGYSGSTQLHGEWLNENLAYRIEPRTDHDTATVDLWIPLPPDPGPYVVKVEATYAGCGLDSAQTGPFG